MLFADSIIAAKCRLVRRPRNRLHGEIDRIIRRRGRDMFGLMAQPQGHKVFFMQTHLLASHSDSGTVA